MAAGDFNLTDEVRFPAATVVEAYRDRWDFWPGLGVVVAAEDPSATMTAGVAAFTGLTPGGRYFARANIGGVDRIVRFTADP